MKNISCLFTCFPWDLFLFLLLLGLLLWFLLSYLSKRCTARKTTELEARVLELEAALKTCEESKKSKGATAQQFAAAPPTQKDNLKIVEGIGPKIEQLLYGAGIYTYAQLADAKPVALKKILSDAGPNFAMHTPDTWPKQAEMARDAKWDELKKWQSELKGGVKA